MRFTIDVEVEHRSGRFAQRADIEGMLVETLEQADLSGLGDDGDSEYEVTHASAR